MFEAPPNSTAQVKPMNGDATGTVRLRVWRLPMLGAQKVVTFVVLSSEKGRLFWCRPLSPRVYWRFLS